MEINFKDFVVLYDKTSYESYKAACVEKLLGEGSEAIPQAMASDSTVQFPDPPERYPCLVASLVRDKPSLKESKLHQLYIINLYLTKNETKIFLSFVVLYKVAPDSSKINKIGITNINNITKAIIRYSI